MSRPTDVLLEHDADGIREFDNPMPLWWIGLFWVTILWSGAYMAWLAANQWDQGSQYQDEMAAAERQWPKKVLSTADLAALASDPNAIHAGKAVFVANCIPCHGPEAKGTIGPDLTDAEWIHGGRMEDIYKTVDQGVVDKGMLKWGPVLGDEKVRQVTAFVHSLGGGQ